MFPTAAHRAAGLRAPLQPAKKKSYLGTHSYGKCAEPASCARQCWPPSLPHHSTPPHSFAPRGQARLRKGPLIRSIGATECAAPARTVICGTKRSTITLVAPYAHSHRASTVRSSAGIDTRRRNSERSIRHSCCSTPASATTCACLPSPAPALFLFWLEKTSSRAHVCAHRKFGPLGAAVANSRAAEVQGSSSLLLLRALPQS